MTDARQEVVDGLKWCIERLHGEEGEAREWAADEVADRLHVLLSSIRPDVALPRNTVTMVEEFAHRVQPLYEKHNWRWALDGGMNKARVPDVGGIKRCLSWLLLSAMNGCMTSTGRLGAARLPDGSIRLFLDQPGFQEETVIPAVTP